MGVSAAALGGQGVCNTRSHGFLENCDVIELDLMRKTCGGVRGFPVHSAAGWEVPCFLPMLAVCDQDLRGRAGYTDRARPSALKGFPCSQALVLTDRPASCLLLFLPAVGHAQGHSAIC